MQRALDRQISPPHAIFFLGDGLRDLDTLRLAGVPVYSVRGNCDWFSAFDHTPTEQLIRLGGLRILLTHGHLYGVKSGYGALAMHATRQDADIALFGHTHLPYAESIPKGTLSEAQRHPIELFNPGSIGVEGSFGVLTIQNGKALLSHGQI